MTTEVAPQSTGKLINRFGERYGVDPRQVMSTLKQTAFRVRDGEVSNAQMMALMIVADQYKLNPFTKEIYAFPDKQNGIVPVVGVDGWSRIINSDPQFDGMNFRQSDKIVELPGAKPCPEWMEVVFYRKDRQHPIIVREYLDEVYRPPFTGTKNNREFTVTGPWQTHTKRMLRHKAMIQGARIAFGFVGIYDEDEAERIREARGEPVNVTGSSTATVKTVEPEMYGDANFKRDFPDWEAAIKAGDADAEDVIASAESLGMLTDDQKIAIRDCAIPEFTDAEEVPA